MWLCSLATNAAFAEPAPRWQVEFMAPAACPGEQDFRRALDARMEARSPVSSLAHPPRIVVSIRAVADGWAARLEVESSADGARVERAAQSRRCEDLLPALALMTALAPTSNGDAMTHATGARTDDGLSAFLAARPRLFGIAHRMLGSRFDAEDVVQEVWLRWQATDRSVVRSAPAFLATTTIRLAINHAQSARARRETSRDDGEEPERLTSGDIGVVAVEPACEVVAGALASRPVEHGLEGIDDDIVETS